jgi:hypothetical protein
MTDSVKSVPQNREDYAAALKDVFATGGDWALKRAMVKDPLRILREIQAVVADKVKTAAPAGGRELTDAELDERGRLLLRALGRDRMERLMNEPDEGSNW